MYQTLNMHPAKSSVFFRGPTTLTSAQKLPVLDVPKRSKTRDRNMPTHQNLGSHSKLGAKQVRALHYDSAAPYDSICSTSYLEGRQTMKQLPTKAQPKNVE